MLITWLQDRAATWLLYMCALFIFGGLSLFLFLLDGGGTPRLLSIGLGTETFLFAFFLIWTAMRVLEGRAVQWALGASVLVGWAVVCFVPHALDGFATAVVAHSLLGAAGVGAAAYELWRGLIRQRLFAGWLMCGLLAAVALSFGLRFPLLTLLPFPFGTLPMQTESIAIFVLSLVGAALILSVLSIMLAKERAGVELRAFAFTDPLTGLLNRRAFSVDAARVARKHQQSKTGYCVVMFDLDHFKSINDNYGHDAGDAVLKVFAAAARASLPDRDAVYRIGGEEFCCILPETDVPTAQRIADSLRVSFRSTGVVYGERSIDISVSGGVGSSSEAGTDPAKVQALADEALYRAKRLGRDRICSGSHEPLRDLDIDWAAA